MKKQLLLFLSALTISTQAQTFTCGDTLVDTRDGKKYPTVLIGTQCWMKKNLDYGVMVNSVNTGTPHSDVSNNGTVEKYCFGNSAANCTTYGGLYDWDEMMNYSGVEGGQGICPNGWHVPSMAEYSVLCNSSLIGGNALKTLGEGVGMGVGTNTTGWSGKLGGDRGSPGVFTGTASVALFWSSTSVSALDAKHLYILGMNDSIKYWTTMKASGFSCRCVKNAATGFNEKVKTDLFNIYPNPADENVKIIMSNNSGNGKIALYNITGEIVLEENINGHEKDLSVQSLPPGIYFVKVFTDGRVLEKKLIITK